MVDSAELIKKVRFPRQLVAFSVVATQAITFAVMLVILIVLSLIFIPGARATVWLALPLAVLYAGFVAGVALVVACLNVILRDIEHILAAALHPLVLPDPDPLELRARSRRPRRAHHKLIEVLRWGNFVAPPIAAVRDALWSGHVPARRRRGLPRGRGGRRARARLDRLQPDRRPARDRAVAPPAAGLTRRTIRPS